MKHLPKPYYDKDGITIYCADCREILPLLPDKSVDLVLTDPPYGIGEAAGKNVKRDGYGLARAKDYGSLSWDDTVVSNDLILSCLNKAKRAIIFGGNYYSLPPTSCWLVWDKDNGSNDFADCELAWTNLNKAVRLLRWRWNGMLRQNVDRYKEERFHPTQKPLAVITWCISHVQECCTILDPFLGSGTTAVAAKKLGRRCIGIEIEEKYCDIAVKRLDKVSRSVSHRLLKNTPVSLLGLKKCAKQS